MSANGDYVFTATDNAGNATTATAHIANIDTAAPGLSFALAPSSGWTKGSVTITATGSDTGSGVASIRRPDGTTATGSTANYAVTANGTYSFTATDNAGNTTTQSVTVSNIDTTAPSLSCTPSTTAWTNGSVTLTASASDSQSGLASITKPDNSTSATSPTTYTAAANGTYTFSAADNAGNTTSLPMTVSNIDTTAPTSPVVTSSTTAWTNGNVTFTLGTSTDSQSGVAKRQYQIDGGAWTDYSSTVTVSTEGTHTIYARAVDNVGNISTVSNATVKIDKTAPTVPAISGAPSGWTSQTVNLMVSGSTDGASGIAYTRYQIDGGSWLDYTGPVSISADGAHTFTVHVGDTAGNFSTASAAVNIDKTAPAASGSLSPSANTTGPVAITVTGSDAGSGVASVKRPDETTAYGATATYTVTDNGTYTFIVTDNAGNTYTLPVTVGNIDKTVSVTLTSSVSYTVNPNNLSTPMTAEDITITNNSGFPIQVTLSSLTSSLSGTNGFWLGTKVREGTTGGGTWSQIDNSGVQYAGGASVVLGVLPAGATGHIQLISDLPSLKWPVLETDSGNAQLQFTASN